MEYINKWFVDKLKFIYFLKCDTLSEYLALFSFAMPVNEYKLEFITLLTIAYAIIKQISDRS